MSYFPVLSHSLCLSASPSSLFPHALILSLSFSPPFTYSLLSFSLFVFFSSFYSFLFPLHPFSLILSSPPLFLFFSFCFSLSVPLLFICSPRSSGFRCRYLLCERKISRNQTFVANIGPTDSGSHL